MSFDTMTKKIALYSAAMAAIAASQGAFAHTGVRDTVDVTSASGKTSYNAFTITHGCAAGEDGEPLPVIGQSAVFPHGDSAVWVKLSDGSATTAQAVIGAPLLNLGAGGVQDASLFKIQNEEADEDEVVHAINWKGGKLDPTLAGLTQFRVSVPKIVDKCVSKLRIRIAVSNWCKLKANEANDPEKNRADWWFTGETGTTKFTDPDLIQPTYWTTLTANNLSFDAAACGTGYEVAVMPSGADIDKWLPHGNFTANPAPF